MRKKVLPALAMAALLTLGTLPWHSTSALAASSVAYYDKDGNEITVSGMYYDRQGNPMYGPGCYYLDAEGNPVYVGGCRAYYYDAEGNLIEGDVYYDAEGNPVTRGNGYRRGCCW
jgi:hypothetical protein